MTDPTHPVAHPAPSDPALPDHAPALPTTVDLAPVDPAPVDPAPVDPAPVDPAPVDPAPAPPVPSRWEIRQRALDRRRANRQRERIALVAALLVALAVIGSGLITGGRGSPSPSADSGVRQEHGSSAPDGSAAGSGKTSVPSTGPSTFTYVSGTGDVLGSGGEVHRFRVAVEDGTGIDPAGFGRTIESILSDPRGWTAGGDLRFQRVGEHDSADFTISVATPGTVDKLCGQGGLHTDGFLSCALPDKVIINLARWLTGVPGYGASLAEYRQYVVNHEIGRELGGANEACPGLGQPAPVMQQQSLGLAGCVANPWPYLNGQPYHGPALP